MTLALTVAAACTGDGSEDQSEAFTADPECFGINVADLSDDEVECGTVTVPLHHDEPDGEQIELAVAVLAGDEDSADEPLLVLGGGPGQVLVESVLSETLQQQIFATGRETILIDQRGVGASEPALNCPANVQDALSDIVAEDTDAWLDEVSECRDSLAEDGIDLDAFNNRNNALDVDAVRAALGHDQLNIRGGSYGSHLALHAAALNPEGVRSLVLSSPIDPSMNYLETAAGGFETALDRLADACAATPMCHDEVGDLGAAIDQVIDRLADRPEDVTVELPEGEQTTDTYTPATFLSALHTLFYLPDGAFALPALVADARDGDLEPLAEIVAAVREQLEDAGTTGMQISMVCSGEGGAFDPQDAAAQVDSQTLDEHWLPYDPLSGATTTQLCDLWDVDEAYDPGEFTFAQDVPALVVTGEIDHVTPPEHGEQVSSELDTAHLVEVPSVAHSPLEALDQFTQGCGQQIVDEFLADPDSSPDTTCVDQMPPLEPLGEMPDTSG